ncbi:Dps family protein [Tellurirhabdus rosea]|uniref:Dps family protein n=1 Tax=Tellurirhabdus rosea TaxID=2674997 RepID=UPI002257F385|nr:DNA starvation/stationary phase protection protein [Tellurirhabdus rosea]
MFTNVSFYTNGFMLNEVKKPKTKASARNGASETEKAEPILNQQGHILQSFGTVLQRVPLALEEDVRKNSVNDLNQILADTITLRDLYKKHHWQIVGPTFYQLHLLFDKHYEEQNKLVDEIAERIQLLGGLSLAMAADIAETTRIPRPPRDREEVPVQISRLLEAHDLVLKQVRETAQRAAEAGDDGTNDLLVSQVLRTNELQAWFLYEHVVETPVVRAE